MSCVVDCIQGKEMGKKKTSVVQSDELPVIEFRYAEPLFQFVCHPEEPMVVSALATGHVLCHRYDAELLTEKLREARKVQEAVKVEEKKQTLWTVVDVDAADKHPVLPSGVTLLWRTKRHKGSVRALAIDHDGKHVYTIGADNVLKKADTHSGKVVKKVTLDGGSKVTKLVKSATHDFLVMGDEVGTIVVLDSNDLTTKNTLTKIHGGDAINDIFQFCKRSVYKYISLGQTTLAYWDTREPKMKQPKKNSGNQTEEELSNIMCSDDQEDEILCGAFVDPIEGDTLVCGMGEGTLTVWKPKKNDLEDQLTRVKIAKGESIDTVISTLQDDNCVWCGCSNGLLYKVDTKRGKIVEIRKHSGLDEVGMLDLDFEYRLVSGGMDKLKIWEVPKEENSDSDSDSDINDDSEAGLSSSEDSDSDSELGSGSESEVESDVSSKSDSDLEEFTGSDLPGDIEGSEGENNSNDDDNHDDREELWKELDQPTSDEEEPPKKRSLKVKDKKNKKFKKNENNLSHGITKFDGL